MDTLYKCHDHCAFFFFLNATEGIIADWLQFYHLVISNFYFYFGVSINTLERRGRSMAAEGRNSSAAAAVSTRSLKTAANQTSSPSFSTDSTFIKHSQLRRYLHRHKSYNQCEVPREFTNWRAVNKDLRFTVDFPTLESTSPCPEWSQLMCSSAKGSV